MCIYTEILCTFLCLHIKSCLLRREVCSHSKYNLPPKSDNSEPLSVAPVLNKRGNLTERCLLGVYMAELLSRRVCCTATGELLLGKFTVQRLDAFGGHAARLHVVVYEVSMGHRINRCFALLVVLKKVNSMTMRNDFVFN